MLRPFFRASSLVLGLCAYIFSHAQGAPQSLIKASNAWVKAYETRNPAGLVQLLTPDFYLETPAGANLGRAAYALELKAYINSTIAISLKDESSVVRITKDSAEIHDETIYDEQFKVNGKPARSLLREQSLRWWRNTPEGWKISHIKLTSTEFQDGNGQWRSSQAAVGQMQLGKGTGPAPSVPIERILRKIESGFDHKDQKAFSEDLAENFVSRQMDGSSLGKAEDVKRFEIMCKQAKSLKMLGNHRLDTWTQSTARTTSFMVLETGLIADGKETRILTRSCILRNWKLTTKGWKIASAQVVASEFADSKGGWHAFPIKQKTSKHK